jgi:hypothetical protein
VPELIQGTQPWAQEDLDSNVFDALPEVDNPAVQQSLRKIQQRFQGDSVVGSAVLRQATQTVPPLLEIRKVNST